MFPFDKPNHVSPLKNQKREPIIRKSKSKVVIMKMKCERIAIRVSEAVFSQTAHESLKPDCCTNKYVGMYSMTLSIILRNSLLPFFSECND